MNEAVLELSKKQFDFINRTERIGLLLGGLGFGKSFVGALWIVLKALNNPKSACVMASKDYGQLTQALDKEVQIIFSLMGLVQGIHYSRVVSPKLTYTFKNKSTLTGVSALNYDSSLRAININFLLLDEVAFYEKEAFQTALGRVRKNPSQIRCVSTPQGFNFIWDYFVDKPAKDSFIITATTYDNKLLPPEYAQSLKDSYPDKLFRQECMAEFIDLTAESAYYSFNRADHTGNVLKEEGVPVYVALDFNVAPMAGIFFQVINNKIMVFDELYIEDSADTYRAVEIITQRVGNNINVISDSTGGNRSTVGPSNHTILRNAGFKLIPSRNPFVFDRVQHLNKILEDKRVLIDKNCINLIRCLSKTVWGSNGKLDQSKDKTLTHASDSLGYACFKLFPPKSNSVRPIIFS